MSENALEGKKGLPDSGKDLSEYDFIMVLQGKKYPWIRLEKVRQEQGMVFCKYSK